LAQINFKTGNENRLPSAKAEGTVYFTVDTDNNIGKIYLDHSNTQRVNIVPDKIDCGAWDVVATIAASCCFVAGSKVRCDAAGAVKNIEDIKAGDTVLSYNIFTEQFYPVAV
jgi:hypothetical protein